MGRLCPVARNGGVGKGLGLMWFVSSAKEAFHGTKQYTVGVVEVEAMLKFHI